MRDTGGGGRRVRPTADEAAINELMSPRNTARAAGRLWDAYRRVDHVAATPYRAAARGLGVVDRAIPHPRLLDRGWSDEDERQSAIIEALLAGHEPDAWAVRTGGGHRRARGGRRL